MSQLSERARAYLAANAAESGADVLIQELVDAHDDMLAALKLARRSMIVSVTGISDGLTIHNIKQWIEQADAAIAKAEGQTP